MNGRRLLGYTFVFAGLAGALFCLYGIVQVWRFRPQVEKTARGTLDVTLQTLEATEDGLEVIDDLVTTSAVNVQVLETTIQTLTLTISNTNAVLGSLTTLTGEDLPETLDATQTSLASAQTSAALIDDFMTALAGVPLLRLGAYQPEVPLSTALGDISDSLDPLDTSLDTIRVGLEGASVNLSALEGELESVELTTKEIRVALEGAREVIADYEDVTGDLIQRVENMERVASANIRTGALILTILLLLLFFPQIGVVERGRSLLREAESMDA